MIGKPQFEFSYRYLQHGNRPRRFRALGELSSYPEVRAFQMTYNAVWSTSQTLPAGQRIGGSTITVDGKYGSESNGAMKRYVNFLALQGHAGCSATGGEEVSLRGPNAARACLLATGMSEATVTVLQQAWREWYSTPEPEDRYAAQREACRATGGTWNAATNSCAPGLSPTPGPTPPSEAEGMSTGAWVLLFALGAVLVGGTWYIFSD